MTFATWVERSCRIDVLGIAGVLFLSVRVDWEAGSLSFEAVCIRVLTTSSGHVRTPANPPAVVAVSISRPMPISSDSAYCLAHFRSCS